MMKSVIRKIWFVLVISMISAVFPINGYQVEAKSVTKEVSYGFENSSYVVPLGETISLKGKFLSKDVKYRVGDSSVLKIEKDGSITGLQQGRTYLYATDGENTYRCLIAVLVERLSTPQTSYTITHDEVIYVKFQDRKLNEKLIVSSADETIVKAEVEGYEGDQVAIALNIENLGTTTLQIGRSHSMEELTIEVVVKEQPVLSAVDIYKKCSSAMVEIVSKTSLGDESLGSGFFVSPNHIVTNYHVIENSVSLVVTAYDGEEFKVEKLLDYDETFDLALLLVDADHEYLEVSYAPAVTGDRIYTIGSPYGLTGTFSTGIVSKALRMLDDDIFYIQITASISRGNSGGPLINRYGEVIGVNTLTRMDGQNLNFSVPMTYYLNLNSFSGRDIESFYDANKSE